MNAVHDYDRLIQTIPMQQFDNCHEYEELLISRVEQGSQMLETQYGDVSFLEWCALEVDRINRKARRNVAQVLINGGGRVGMKWLTEAEKPQPITE
jgi:hypothetical protein